MGRKALGRGLGALLPEHSEDEGSRVRHIPVADIEPNPFQPRMNLDEAGIEELKRSIQEKGVIQPIVVRKLEGGRYQIVIGERRWRAVKEAGMETIPAIVREVSSAEEMIELALVENIQREDLNPIDEANAYRVLMEECHLTQEEVAQRVGKDRSTVANLLRLLKLPDEVQERILDGELSMGHARALLALEDPQEQVRLCREIIKNGWSVRKVEQVVRARRAVRREEKPKDKDPILRDLEEELQRALGTAVRIVQGGKKGRIEIEFYSNRDLERLVALLMR
ncbi:MAG TPA: ParB/RepB/Spo0J family partition protein [Candidatus Latescibacteria bacterium]|nr:ParB/RepB/Spo0J family partition protein [Candidatus Latescibacterota bacterium]